MQVERLYVQQQTRLLCISLYIKYITNNNIIYILYYYIINSLSVGREHIGGGESRAETGKGTFAFYIYQNSYNILYTHIHTRVLYIYTGRSDFTLYENNRKRIVNACDNYTRNIQSLCTTIRLLSRVFDQSSLLYVCIHVIII